MKKKIISFVKDVFLNTFAFAIYILAQQVILFPFFSKTINETIYAKFLIYISALNVICNSFGGQLGVTRVIKNKFQNDSDYYILFIKMSIITTLFSIIFLIYYKYNIIQIIMLTIVMLLTNFRLYMGQIFRIKYTYSKVIIINVFYFVGIILGIFYCKIMTPVIWIPLLLGEIISFIYGIRYVNITNLSLKKTKFYNEIKNNFKSFSIASFLSNGSNLVDKLLVYPLLGEFNLIIYTVSSTMYKIISLLINPVNNVIVVRLSKTDSKKSKKIIITALKISLISLLIVFLLGIPFIYISTFFLYNQYLPYIKEYIVIMSLSCSISTVAGILKSFVINYTKSNNLVWVYLLHLVLLALFGFIGAKYYGLLGFVISTIFSRLQVLICFFFILWKKKGDKKYEKDKEFVETE